MVCEKYSTYRRIMYFYKLFEESKGINILMLHMSLAI